MNLSPEFKLDLVVSTTAFRRRPLEDVIRTCKDHRLKMEFSSGIPYRPDLEKVYLDADCPRMLHNYFPAPAEPFVLNLASLDPATLERSVEHCRNALRMTQASGAPFFSVHAGFRYDPDPKLLGKPLQRSTANSKEESWQRFLQTVDLLSAEAEKLGVRFLVENTVIAKFNILADGSNPFFCSAAEEINELFRQVRRKSLGILMDTGHWKVSAGALGFRLDTIQGIFPHIHAFHHSDNGGEEDTNGPLGANYWLLPYMPHFRDCVHVLEVHDQPVEEIRRQFRLLEDAAFKG